MIKEVKVFNRLGMEKFARNEKLKFPYKCWYLISIHSGDVLVTPFVQRIFKKMGCQDVLSLEFWDVTSEDYESKAVIFDKSHAKQIVDFIDSIQKEDKDSTLVVHCHAGISRSGAVGTFACDYCRLDYNEFKNSNKSIMPNVYVLSILRDVAGMNPSFGTVIKPKKRG